MFLKRYRNKSLWGSIVHFSSNIIHNSKKRCTFAARNKYPNRHDEFT